MPDLSDLNAMLEARRPRPSHPPGWEPGYEWDGHAGTLTTGPLDAEPDDWDDLLAALGAPAFLTVDPNAPIAFTSWDGWRRDHPDDTAVSATQRSFRCRLIRRTTNPDFDYPELAAHIRQRRRPKTVAPTGQSWLVVPVADMQTGKRAGGGLQGLADRMKTVEANLVDHVANLRRIGVDLGGVVIAGMGDIVEGCQGFYAPQTAEVHASRRDQIRAAKDMIWSLVDTASPLFDRVLLTAVAGNHGENRAAGRGAATNPRQDNDDLLVFEWIADALTGSDRYAHVQARFPEDQLATSFDLDGSIVGFTHGHQFDRGTAGLPVAKAIRWWEKQQMGRRPVADADVLVFAHFHHPVVVEWSAGRWLVQCPTIDGGSPYFAEGQGVTSSPGMACFVTSVDRPVDHWRIL